MLNNPMDEEDFTEALCSELYALNDEDLPESAFPLSYRKSTINRCCNPLRNRKKSSLFHWALYRSKKNKRTHLL
jgi:hypothetical protein